MDSIYHGIWNSEIHLASIAQRLGVDGRDIGERSDAVFDGFARPCRFGSIN